MILSRDLSYGYGKGPSLAFPDVNVPQGDLLLLSGPSGSGKSTWLALAAAFMKPDGGQLVVAGQSLTEFARTSGRVLSDGWRARHIGFLPQKLHLSSALTVHGNLAMAQWAAGQKEDMPQIDITLSLLGVAELAARKPSALSGGQAQRVALARAVLLKPRVILADEPTASLDDDTAASALALLQATAQRESATLVIATHDARVSAFFAGSAKVHRLVLGRVVS